MSTDPFVDIWNTGESYQQYVGRWSLKVGARFLDWIDQPDDLDWLDVGCGTGTLARLILERSPGARVTGVDPSAGFIAYATEQLASDRATFVRGDARSLPSADGSYDVVVSGLVLNFVPNEEQGSAAAELVRVCRPGGTIAAYVWDYADGMQMMRHFWDAAVALDPAALSRDESQRFQLCHPERLEALFGGAGLEQIESRGIEIETRFSSFDDYWTPFLSGEAPAPKYAMSLTEEAREQLKCEIRSRLPIEADGTIRLTARAWAVRGTTPTSA